MKLFILLLISASIRYAQSRPHEQIRPKLDASTVEKTDKITILPFYGGGKGQSLEIRETTDGIVTTNIIKNSENPIETSSEEEINASDLEMPSLPSKYEYDEFGKNIKKNQSLALEIIKLEETASANKGKLNRAEEKNYKESMDALSLSAQNLSRIQEDLTPFDFEQREGLSSWFERKSSNKKDKNKKKEDEDKKKKEEENKRKCEADEKRKKDEEKKNKEEEKKKKEEEEKKNEEEEKKKGEKEEEDLEEDNDSVAINLPPEDASVAEAKPVGLAVAGEGGVAASKPVATAVVGPGGLAIARPVGTAIAGVSPEQALLPIDGENYLSGTIPKKSLKEKHGDPDGDFLIKLINKYHQI